ncbi:MAG: hypothetical protein JSW17_04630 [Candidatus Omnitrophota bacterium]|nr:MAG: hypothetical protein JSW17_04630 [Candidatus Omnitrophota bacterium]
MKLENINNTTLIWGMISQEGLDHLKEEKSLVVVPENRPYLIGLKHNIPLLKKEGIDFVYCCDNVLGLLFYKERIKKTLLFYKELNQNGITGICGSLYVTLLSKLHNIPIKIAPQGRSEIAFEDADASSLGGNLFLEERQENCIIKAGDEVIETDLLIK